MTSSAAPKALSTKVYEKALFDLQVKLATMQNWVQETGRRVVIVCEGRDGAGKGGAIARLTGAMPPRWVRHEALPTPTSRERGQWYFQRYVDKLPTAGEIVIYDRSWYNRAGVEKVMGYCTQDQYEAFMRAAPRFEQLLIDDGIILLKYWFSVSDEEQMKRFRKRAASPLKQWKLSPTDLESINKWREYSEAKDAMFARTDTPDSPWWSVESDDKKAARLNFIYHVLHSIPYEEIPHETLVIPERVSSGAVVRPPRNYNRLVPDYAASLMG
ncbi:MAG: polyphosphate kinase 2 [Cellulomonadaceae bacterium]|jgi:polyphosphate kinase 2|nr:polyphosphate kinase 2 [Cellulomonadaceae bacterium]